MSELARTVEHTNQGLTKRFDGWVVWCQCGFLETGWPNYAVARCSLDAHNEKVSRSTKYAAATAPALPTHKEMGQSVV